MLGSGPFQVTYHTFRATGITTYLEIRSLIRDVTERKRRRRERRNRLEALSTTIPGAAFEFRVGPGGKRSVDFMGAEVTSLLGLSAGSEALFERLLRQIPESHREGLLQSIEEAAETQSRWQQEIPFEGLDGERIWLLGSSKPTVEGEDIVFRGTLLDITDRKNVEKELREGEKRLRGLANSIPGIVYQFYARPDGTYGHYFVSENSEEVLGISADPDGYYDRFIKCVPESHREAVVESIDQAVEAEETWRHEFPFQWSVQVEKEADAPQTAIRPVRTTSSMRGSDLSNSALRPSLESSRSTSIRL
jgi:PAS domain S-box-containing protein